MPYSIPGMAIPSQGHSGHRRSHSNISFITGGPSTFTPMAPPRRKTVPTPRFHLKSDDSSHSDDDDAAPAPVMKAAPASSHSGGVLPFPRTSPLSSPVPQQAKVPFPITTSSSSPRPFARTSSTPNHLSNGKPLKSSLKSSSSYPHIPFPSQSLVPSRMHPHSRAASAPTMPHFPCPPSSPTHSPTHSHSPSPSPQTPSAHHVHFPSQEEGGLATIRLFKHSARPAALSKPDGEETETETEGEGSVGGWPPYGGAYPFPRVDVGSRSCSPSPLRTEKTPKFEIDPTLSSPVPSPSLSSSGLGNVHLESLLFSSDTMNLSGTLLVRNLTYEKVVAVRFTLDEWDTASEVLAKYVVSLPSFSLSSSPFPSSYPSAGNKTTLGDVLGTTNTEGWDRFGFSIHLEDHAHNLSERTMWLVVRYVAEGCGEGKEWWDNNGGANYRVAFRSLPASRGRERKRQVALSAPPAFPLPPKLSSSSSLPPSWTVPSHSSSSSSKYPTTAFKASSYPLPPTLTQNTGTRTQPTTMSQAKAQTTLTHLKKLNLRNYAAPGTVGAAAAAAAAVVTRCDAVSSESQGFVESSSSCAGNGGTRSSSPPTTSPPTEPTPTTKDDRSEGNTSPSSLTSTPLTSPLHTPVEEHAFPLTLVHGLHGKEEKEKDDEKEEGGLPASLSRFSGSEREEGLAISPREGRGMGMDIITGFPATIISGPKIGAEGGEMSTGVSPPFSSFAFNSGNGNGMYWSWGAKYSSPPAHKSPSPVRSTPKSSSPDPTTSPLPTPTPKSSSPLLTPPGAKHASKPTLTPLLLHNIRKKSTHSPPRSPIPWREEKAPSSGSSGSEADSKKTSFRGGVETLLQEDSNY